MTQDSDPKKNVDTANTIGQSGCDRASMRAVAATESPELANRLVSRVRRLGVECTQTNFVSVNAIIRAIHGGQHKIDVLFVELPDSEDETILLLRELRVALDSRIVAVGAARSPRDTLGLIRSGAHDFLDESDDLDQEIVSLFERVVAERTITSAPGPLFTVTSCSGGCGTSLVAANMAAQLTRCGSEVGLVDLQMRGGDLATLLKLAPQHTISHLLEKEGELDVVITEQSLAAHSSGIRLLAGPDLLCDPRHTSPQVVKRIVQFIRSLFPYTVVELGDVLQRDQISILAESERVVLVFRLDFVSLLRTKKLVDYLMSVDVSKDRIAMVANRVGRPGELPIRDVARALEMPIAAAIPEESAVINCSVNAGFPVVLESPSSRSARALIELTAQLCGKQEGVAVSSPGLLRRGRTMLTNILKVPSAPGFSQMIATVK